MADYWDESLKTALRLGYNIDQYNEMTPRELYIAAQAYNENKEAEMTEHKHTLYMQAVLNRVMIWAKKNPPQYEKLFREPKKPMTDEQMYKAVVMLNKAFGGDDIRGR